jgi:hypothetical protein
MSDRYDVILTSFTEASGQNEPFEQGTHIELSTINPFSVFDKE